MKQQARTRCIECGTYVQEWNIDQRRLTPEQRRMQYDTRYYTAR